MTGEFPPAGQCVPIVRLGSAVLADLLRWTSKWLPGFEYLPLPAIAFGEAVVGPWATAEQLRVTGRMAVWAYALDDHVEREITGLAALDEFFARCSAIVHTGGSDDGHPLLSALSAWQQELTALPGYPALAPVWREAFDACLSGHRYDWVVGWARDLGELPATDATEYLEHSDSSAVGQVHVPRWVVYGGAELPSRLDVLRPALTDVMVATRLANDLSTFERERAEPGQNNLLMYGVSADWVQAEIGRRLASVHTRLEPLVAADFRPAVGLVRLADWCVGIYAGHDMRVVAQPDPPSSVSTSGERI
jgi:hypothetical protein